MVIELLQLFEDRVSISWIRRDRAKRTRYPQAKFSRERKVENKFYVESCFDDLTQFKFFFRTFEIQLLK
ncbi:hypothetical protein WJ23_27750 [Burkholderia lata]|nr:hypothetical protein WJ23_27750 [Burkholderia lata]